MLEFEFGAFPGITFYRECDSIECDSRELKSRESDFVMFGIPRKC